jgi:hypothetical protein
MRRKLAALLLVCTTALVVAVPAFAFDCTVAKKPPTAGAFAIVNESTGELTFLKKNPGAEEKPHGAFIAITDGTITASTFLRAPGGVLPPAREGGSQHNCDGKGIDSLEVCFGE